MDRRKFLKNAGLAAGATAASTLAAPAIAQGITQLKLVTSWPKNFPGLGTAPEDFATLVNQMTNGRYEIRVFGGGELVPALKCHDAVQEGTAEMYHSADYYYTGKLKGYAYFCAVPMGLTAVEMMAWTQSGGMQELWDEAGAQFGIKHLVGGNTGVQMGGWFTKPFTTLEDFKGLKMRIPGLGGEVIAQLGGTSVTLAGAEILPALQSGTIDAAEWVGPWNDLAFGFHKVAKHYHYPGFHEPGSMLGMGISTKVWDAMSAEDKAIFDAAAWAVHARTYARFTTENARALVQLVNDHGVILEEFSDDLYRKFGEAANDVLSTAANSDPLTKKIHESFLDFRKKAADWGRLGEQGYMNKRALTL